ncbi:hypothetical protein [Polaromonas sp.]|uniref:hypothetical protein n=1 Tax=Polaromonas sp. TaxID=1869339 RepID=UPI0035649C89
MQKSPSHYKLVFCGCFDQAGGLPGGNSLSFCVAKKKVSKEKGAPAVCVPPLRCGQPAVLVKSGVELELAFGSDNRSP